MDSPATMKKETTMQVLRVKDVCQRLRVSRTTVWRLDRSGDFPPKRRIGPGTVGYLEEDVAAWLATRSEPKGRRRG
jgi:prophage regulatory protein